MAEEFMSLDMFSDIESRSLKRVVAHHLQNSDLFGTVTDPDVYTLHAAQINHIGYMDVTPEQRKEAKRFILMAAYGVDESVIAHSEYERQFYVGTPEFERTETGRMVIINPPLEYRQRY